MRPRPLNYTADGPQSQLASGKNLAVAEAREMNRALACAACSDGSNGKANGCGGTPRLRERIKKPSREQGLKDPARPTFALVGTIIGSESLTTVFGMGTGVAFPIWSP